MNIHIGVQALAHRFQVVRQIGHGRYSQVFLIRHKDNRRLFALKTVQLFGLCQFEIQNCIQEALILFTSQHANITRIYECFYNPQEEVIYIVLEYAQKGDLQSMLQKHKQANVGFKQSFVWKVLTDVADGLNYLHSASIWHRDIKPANIFMTKQGFKIGDFNISQIVSEGEQGLDIAGTPNYLSPEKYFGKKQDEKSDVWSLGMICYQLCCLTDPHSTSELNEKRFSKGRFNIGKIPSEYSLTLQQIIQSLLSKIEKRPSSGDILNYCSRCGLHRPIKKANSFIHIKSFLRTFNSTRRLLTVDVLEEYSRYKKLAELAPVKSISFLPSISNKQNSPKRKIVKRKQGIFQAQKYSCCFGF